MVRKLMLLKMRGQRNSERDMEVAFPRPEDKGKLQMAQQSPQMRNNSLDIQWQNDAVSSSVLHESLIADMSQSPWSIMIFSMLQTRSLKLEVCLVSSEWRHNAASCMGGFCFYTLLLRQEATLLLLALHADLFAYFVVGNMPSKALSVSNSA